MFERILHAMQPPDFETRSGYDTASGSSSDPCKVHLETAIAQNIEIVSTLRNETSHFYHNISDLVEVIK